MGEGLQSTVKPPSGRQPENQLDEIRGLILRLCEQVEELKEKRTRLRTREEAAEVLRISESKLDDLADTGHIQPVRIGRRVLYHPDEIQRFIESRKNS
jgi:excisionase family DNA binding protein